MPDTPLGITYPGSGAHARLWEHFETMALDTDGLLQPILTLAPLTYVPALTADTTNPTLGGGNVRKGWYFKLGQMVIGGAFVKFAPSGNSAGSGIYHLSLPVAALTSGDLVADPATEAGSTLGACGLRDDSVPTAAQGQIWLATATTITMRHPSGTVTDASPWGWAANDVLSISFAYIAA